MTKEELAARLNGREYRNEMTKEEELQARDSGLVAIFGYSDDNVELNGAIDDEIGAFEGTEIFLTPEGVLQNECDDEDCPYFEKILASAKNKVKAIWDRDGYSWIYETELPHATFEIMEDGEKYCRGIVVAIADFV